MPERTQRPTGPAPWERKEGGGDGPKSPDVKKPDTKSILERMRRVDPDQARRYRQRTGQRTDCGLRIADCGLMLPAHERALFQPNSRSARWHWLD